MPPKKDRATATKKKDESFTKRTTFYVNIEWEAGCQPNQGTNVRGQMYVESLEPQRKTQHYPVVLIHGDYHTSQVWLTKPDGDPGWASYFLGKGFHVYLVDLPGTGKSNNLTEEAINNAQVRSIKASQIEREATATKVFNHITDPRWLTALKHDKWPGTGMRGDPAFDRYCASLSPLFFTLEDRQTLAQNALRSLLKITGKAVLIGEGTGATASWLASDVIPENVVGVVAVEPPGPPFCDKTVERNGKRKFDSFTSFNPDRLKYGLSNIPLTFDPPARPEIDPRGGPTGLLPSALDQPGMNPEREPTGLHPLDLAEFSHTTTGKHIVLQYSPENIPAGFTFLKKLTNGDGTMHVRKLINLSKMRHVMITGEASPHSEYDSSTIHFMQQAGLIVDCGFLEKYQIRGNGHLMFLETNSDEVASHIMRWIQTRAGTVDEPIPVLESEVVRVSVPSPQVINVSEQSPRSSKRARRASGDDLTLSLVSANKSQLIDLTDELPDTTRYYDSGCMPTAFDGEHMMCSESTTISPGLCGMPAPPLPSPHSQSNMRQALLWEQGTPVCTNFDIKARKCSSKRPELFIQPRTAVEGSASVVGSSSKPAQANLQHVIPIENEPTGASKQQSEDTQSNHGLFTDYRFNFSGPEIMGNRGDSSIGSSAQHVYDLTQPTLQQPVPSPQQRIFVPFTADYQFYPQGNPYMRSMQGGHYGSSFAREPRFMPFSQPSDDVPSSATDPSFGLPTQNDGESLEMDGYAF